MTKNKILDVYFNSTPAYTVERKQWKGTDYLVVPVTMMVEGVHSGSHGPILHKAEELGKFPESWDGIPVTIGHPQVNGTYVSANSPEVLKDWAVGKIFNTRLEGDALKAEAWIEEETVKDLSPETYQMLQDSEPIEVSVGVFSDEQEAEGEYNGENYNAIAINHRPNHLALLPAEVGACSLEDGCGIRVNKKGGTKVADKLVVNEQNRFSILKQLNQQGLSVFAMGYNEMADKARQALYTKKEADDTSCYLEEIFGDYMVYSMYKYNSKELPKLYKQSYQVNAADEVEFVGEAVQVKREINYSVVPTVNEEKPKRRRKINNNKKESNMADEKCTECVKKLVNNLITNKATAYAESDRDWLENLEEDQLEKMTPQPIQTNKAEVSREQILEVLTANPLSVDDYLKTAPKEVADSLRAGLKLHADRKSKMISTITANSAQWTEEELKELDDKMLEKLYATVYVEDEKPIYVGGFQTNAFADDDDDDILLPPGVTIEKENK